MPCSGRGDAAAQRKYPGRFWGIGAIPLTDGKIAVEVLDHAVKKCGMLGVNIPSSVGDGARIDDRGSSRSMTGSRN